MSDSELSTPADIPADSEIEQCLRRIVRDALEKDENITTNSVRSKGETQLGLDAGFFKDNADWKARSKNIISAAVDEPESPEAPKKKPAAKAKPKPAAKAGTKRKSDEAQPKSKRQKKAAPPVSEDDEEGDGDGDDDEEQPKASSSKRSKKAASDDEEPELDGEEPFNTGKCDEEEDVQPKEPDVKAESTATANGNTVEDDESDLSSVIDDPPPKKKRQKKSSSPATEGKGKSKEKKAAKPAKELSPDEEEIKRLQGWLLKCGIRKIWAIELKKLDTNKAKIKHLKKMLEDIGMTGRYSMEKARQIKESRELAVELEAAKEFNQKWGQKGSGDEDEDDEDEEEEKKDAPPRRLKPRGLIDFGDSGDEGSD
jgi:hypothetical protein